LVRPESFGESKRRAKKGEEFDHDERDGDRPQTRAGSAVDEQTDGPDEESDVGGGRDKSGDEST
jgi:hypothetical protein